MGPGKRKAQRLGWPFQEPKEWIGASATSPLAAMRTERHNVEVRESACLPVISSIEPADDEIRVTGHWVGSIPAAWQPTFSNHRLTLEPTSLTVEGQSFTAVFPTVFDEWGAGELPLPSGTYNLTVVLGSGAQRRLGRRRHQGPDRHPTLCPFSPAPSSPWWTSCPR